MKFCPQCHNITAKDDARFCWLDGAKLVDYVKCACGHELNPIDNYCEYCGKPVEPVERETDARHD